MNQANEQWVQNNWDHFNQSLDEGDYQMAEACIEDARELGFRADAARMQNELNLARRLEEKQDLL